MRSPSLIEHSDFRCIELEFFASISSGRKTPLVRTNVFKLAISRTSVRSDVDHVITPLSSTESPMHPGVSGAVSTLQVVERSGDRGASV